MKAHIGSDEGQGPWFVQSWYEGGEHCLEFRREPDPFRCPGTDSLAGARCDKPRTPGRAACRYHGGHHIRGSNPVTCLVGPGIEAALLARGRQRVERQLEDIEAAIELLELEGLEPTCVWPEYSPEVRS